MRSIRILGWPKSARANSCLPRYPVKAVKDAENGGPSSKWASGEDGARFFRLPSSFRALVEDEMPDQVGYDANDRGRDGTQGMAGHPQFGPRMGRSGSLSADRFLRPAGRNGAGHLRGTRGDADRQACPQRAGAGDGGRRPEHVPAGTDAGTVSYTRANAMRRWPTSRRTMPSPGTPATCRSAATSPSAVTS